MEVLAVLWKCQFWHLTCTILSLRDKLNAASWYLVSWIETFSNLKTEHRYRKRCPKPNLTGKKTQGKNQQSVLQNCKWVLEWIQIHSQLICHKKSQIIRILGRQDLHSLNKAHYPFVQSQRNWVSKPCFTFLFLDWILKRSA